MKKIVVITLLSMLLGACTAFKSATLGEDLYSAHDRVEIAQRQKAAAEAARVEAEARLAAFEAQVAQAKALVAERELLGVQSLTTTSSNPYESVLADDYQSAYARRLYGFSSPSYKMPSSYYTYRYTDAYQYASAYDPAFYNIMVSGDQVWVEPKYITSMFGTWGAYVAVPTYSWYYGWTRPSYYSYLYGYPRYSWYDWGWGYGYDPYWSWGFGWGGYPYHPGFIPPHHHHHYYPPHAVVGGSKRPPVVAHRPSNSSRPGSRPSYISGGARPAASGQSMSGKPQYRGSSSGTVTGSGQYRGSGSRSGANSQYYERSTTRSNDSNNSYQRSNSSSYNRGSSGFGGGPVGGMSSGGSHGGGQGRR